MLCLVPRMLDRVLYHDAFSPFCLDHDCNRWLTLLTMIFARDGAAIPMRVFTFTQPSIVFRIVVLLESCVW